MHSYGVFRKYERTAWTVKDLHWDRLDPSQVMDGEIAFCKGAVMGECNSVAALHNFLNESIDDYDFGAFASIWGYQELQHHYAFRSWLEAVGVDASVLPVELTREPFPPGLTFAATMATNIISELTVCEVYKACAQVAKEPVLVEMLSRMSQDEGRHAAEFTFYARRALQREPGQLRSVLEILYFYMPRAAKDLKHPVSVFKGDRLGGEGTETIDHALRFFKVNFEDYAAALREKIFRTFSALTGLTMANLADVRREIAIL